VPRPGAIAARSVPAGCCGDVAVVLLGRAGPGARSWSGPADVHQREARQALRHTRRCDPAWGWIPGPWPVSPADLPDVKGAARLTACSRQLVFLNYKSNTCGQASSAAELGGSGSHNERCASAHVGGADCEPKGLTRRRNRKPPAVDANTEAPAVRNERRCCAYMSRVHAHDEPAAAVAFYLVARAEPIFFFFFFFFFFG